MKLKNFNSISIIEKKMFFIDKTFKKSQPTVISVLNVLINIVVIENMNKYHVNPNDIFV